MTSVESNLDQLLELLANPVGMILLGLYLLAFVLTVVLPWMRWVALGGFLFTSLLSQRGEEAVLAFPLQQLQQHGRPLCLAMLVLLVVPALFTRRGWRRQLMLPATVMLLIFSLVFSLRLVFSAEALRGMAGGVTFALVFFTLGIGLSKWLQDRQDIHRLLFVVVGVAGVFVLCTMYQLAIDAGAIVHRTRLFGIARNPQTAGIMLGLSLTPLCYLMVQRSVSKIVRIGLGTALGFFTVTMLWTGSRTGLAVGLMGVLLLFHRRQGLASFMLGMSAVATLIVLQIFTDAGQATERLIDYQDTRSHVWLRQLVNFTSSPIVGAIDTEVAPGENSYLGVLSRSGLIGFVPLFIFLIMVATQLWKLYRVRSSFGEDVMLVDLTLAGIVTLLMAGIFESYLVAPMAFSTLMLVIYLTMLAFLTEAAEVRLRQVHYAPSPVSTPRTGPGRMN